jgi:hypothetical protein
MLLHKRRLWSAAARLSIGLTGVVNCAAPGTVDCAGVMPMSTDSTS